MAKNLPVKQEMWVQSLCKGGRLEREMATCKIPWAVEPEGVESMGVTKSGISLTN